MPIDEIENAAKIYANSRAVVEDISIGSMTWSGYMTSFIAGVKWAEEQDNKAWEDLVGALKLNRKER